MSFVMLLLTLYLKENQLVVNRRLFLDVLVRFSLQNDVLKAEWLIDTDHDTDIDDTDSNGVCKRSQSPISALTM